MRPIDDWVRDPGACLYEFRKENHITLKRAAELFESSTSHLSEIENHIAEPSINLLRNFLWWRNRTVHEEDIHDH